VQINDGLQLLRLAQIATYRRDLLVDIDYTLV